MNEPNATAADAAAHDTIVYPDAVLLDLHLVDRLPSKTSVLIAILPLREGLDSLVDRLDVWYLMP
jgi:hypothetical protein